MMDLKSFTPRRLKLLLIAAPLALAALYFAFVAVDRFVSESTVAIHSTGNDAAAIPGAALLLAGISPPAREESLLTREYLHSLGLLQALDAKLGIRRHFEQGGRFDLIARLGSSASQEDFLEYFRNRVDVVVDEQSSALTVRAQAFDAEFAQRLNRALLDAGEQFVNEMSHKLAREKLAFAEGELKRASDQLQQTRKDLLAFQARNRLLDPTVEAQASGTLVAEMQARITRMEADERNLLTFLNPDAYQVRALRSQIEATRRQLDEERSRATGSGKNSGRLGELTADYRSLQLKAEIALDTYKIALAAVEGGRVEATRKLKSLVVVEAPTLPQTAEYPRRLYSLATLLVACLLLYGTVRLVIATVREHQD